MTAEDLGSPWAIGAEEGGHTAVHPQLGTLEDFDRLVAAAARHGLEIALDIAFQCSPDHPYVREHPEWFRKRPDGTIQYAENPPKKYQDIYPLDFESRDWRALWEELRRACCCSGSDSGVRIFRVDNPHTKAFRLLGVGDRRSEAATSRRAVSGGGVHAAASVMYRLAKLGFTQSYTYFTWRNTKQEITRVSSRS